MNVHSILDHSAVFKHFNFLSDTGNGKVITVAVKLNAAKEGKREETEQVLTQRVLLTVACSLSALLPLKQGN